MVGIVAGRAVAGRATRTALVTAALFAVLLWDLVRPPADQWSARALLAGIHLYQATLSRRLPTVGVSCRFEPTCSHYAESSIRKHGALKGTARAGWRLLRCGPWTEKGTADPP